MTESNAETARLMGPLADRDAWRADRCSLGRALQVVGTRSALLLMREAYYGTRRFTDFARRVGVTEAIAAQRLGELVDAGLLSRQPYQDPGSRIRHAYVLTEMGRDLLPAALGLMQWGDRYLADPAGPPLTLNHRDCGDPIAAVVRCTAGHPVALSQIDVRVPEGKRARA